MLLGVGWSRVPDNGDEETWTLEAPNTLSEEASKLREGAQMAMAMAVVVMMMMVRVISN